MKAIHMKLATNRDDGGKTENYRVFNVDAQIKVKNKRGEHVMKSGVLGGNGTIYIANELHGDTDEFVIVPKAEWEKLSGNGSGSGSVKRVGKK